MDNVKRLQIEFTAWEAIPDGGGLADGIDAIICPGRLSDCLKKAVTRTNAAILAVRNAGEPNPFREWTDDQIAGEILRKVWEKRGRCQKCGGQRYHTRLSGYKCFTCDR